MDAEPLTEDGVRRIVREENRLLFTAIDRIMRREDAGYRAWGLTTNDTIPSRREAKAAADALFAEVTPNGR